MSDISQKANVVGCDKSFYCQTPNKILDICTMKFRMDSLHYALLAILVLLVFYAASTYGVFKEVSTFFTRKGR